MSVSGSNGLFSTASGVTTSYTWHPVSHYYIKRDNLLEEDWCSSYTTVAAATPATTFTWRTDSPLDWGDPPMT